MEAELKGRPWGGGESPGEKGAGGVWETGEDGAGSGRKSEKLRNSTQYFVIKKCKEAGANKYRAGTGIKGYWKQEV